jgi:hypothetical protein
MLAIWKQTDGWYGMAYNGGTPFHSQDTGKRTFDAQGLKSPQAVAIAYHEHIGGNRITGAAHWDAVHAADYIMIAAQDWKEADEIMESEPKASGKLLDLVPVDLHWKQ